MRFRGCAGGRLVVPPSIVWISADAWALTVADDDASREGAPVVAAVRVVISITGGRDAHDALRCVVSRRAPIIDDASRDGALAAVRVVIIISGFGVVPAVAAAGLGVPGHVAAVVAAVVGVIVSRRRGGAFDGIAGVAAGSASPRCCRPCRSVVAGALPSSLVAVAAAVHIKTIRGPAAAVVRRRRRRGPAFIIIVRRQPSEATPARRRGGSPALRCWQLRPRRRTSYPSPATSRTARPAPRGALQIREVLLRLQ